MASMTRRQLLSSALVASGAAFATTAQVKDRGSPTGAIESPLVVHGREMRLTSQSFRKGVQPAPGERILLRGDLVSGTGHEPLGRFFGIYSSPTEPLPGPD
jgi:hypothetical protein